MHWLSLGRGTLGLLLAAALTGCISQEELDAVKQERDALKGRIADLEDQLDIAKGKEKECEGKLSKLKKSTPTRPPESAVNAARSQLRLEKGKELTVTLQTTAGDINCKLWPEIAPQTVLNFVGLAEGTKEFTDPKDKETKKEPFYDGTTFHRVIKGFMIQGGDRLGNGRGDPGYRFNDEVWPDVRFDRPGLLAMANSGPKTNGSQFFITDSKPAHLNMKHTIFGECETEVVRKIAGVEVGAADKPKKDVTIKKVVVDRG
jgi:peptidyl-prolyl cis-trans isomerase A (cyclophilin A)